MTAPRPSSLNCLILTAAPGGGRVVIVFEDREIERVLETRVVDCDGQKCVTFVRAACNRFLPPASDIEEFAGWPFCCDFMGRRIRASRRELNFSNPDFCLKLQGSNMPSNIVERSVLALVCELSNIAHRYDFRIA